MGSERAADRACSNDDEQRPGAGERATIRSGGGHSDCGQIDAHQKRPKARHERQHRARLTTLDGEGCRHARIPEPATIRRVEGEQTFVSNIVSKHFPLGRVGRRGSIGLRRERGIGRQVLFHHIIAFSGANAASIRHDSPGQLNT